MSAPIKLSPSDFPKFSGGIDNQEIYKTKAEAYIGQTNFQFLLDQDPDPTILNEMKLDKQLFYVFQSSFLEGTAYYLVTRSLVGATGAPHEPLGRRVWEDFLASCNSGSQKQSILNIIKARLKALKLGGDTVDRLEYVNKFILDHTKLVDIGAKTDEQEMMVNFVDNIVDPDFDTVKQILENYNRDVN